MELRGGVGIAGSLVLDRFVQCDRVCPLTRSTGGRRLLTQVGQVAFAFHCQVLLGCREQRARILVRTCQLLDSSRDAQAEHRRPARAVDQTQRG
jgi:hypothetical protein